MKLEERVAELHGGPMRYWIGGEGSPLVLIHGFLGSAKSMSTWYPEFMKRRTVIVPDLPGSGNTAPLSTAHTSDELAKSVVTLCDGLGIETFDLGGLCLGSSVALAIARDHPDRIDKLILHTPPLRPVLRGITKFQIAVLSAHGPFEVVCRLRTMRTVSNIYKRIFFEGKGVDKSADNTNFFNQMQAEPKAAREWVRDMVRRNDLQTLTHRTGPTLILAGGEDKIVDVPKLALLCKQWTHVTGEFIADAGHGWSRSLIREQVRIMSEFLDAAEERVGQAV